jgi:hypothetical protein
MTDAAKANLVAIVTPWRRVCWRSRVLLALLVVWSVVDLWM